MAFLINPQQNSANPVNPPATQANGAPAVSSPAAFTPAPMPAIEENVKQNYADLVDMGKDLNITTQDNGVKQLTPKDLPALPVEVAEVKPQAQAEGFLQAQEYTLNELLAESIRQKASDIHFTVGYRATVRIDGSLKTFNSPLLSNQIIKDYAKELIKNRSTIDLDNLTEVDLTYSFNNRRFRVNIFKQMGNYSIVCRIIPDKISTIEELELPSILKEFTRFPNGLVLLTGPTGSGKSTTIASLLNHINLTQSKHVITLEDPVEFVFPKGLSIIDQREFDIDFKIWGDALRAVLRQDPDVVLIGEMRDLESVEAALQVAETGHLVFATLHTNGASQTIDRIIDVFPSSKQDQIRIQLASVLRAVVSQKLIPIVTGGRLPSIEVMIANTAVRNAVREKKVFLIDNIIQTSAEEGMISMEKSLVSLVRKGMISIDSAKALSLRPDEIDLILQK